MKIIRMDRGEIALVRVLQGCAELVNQETGEALSIEELLPIVAPSNFAGQKEKRSLSRDFSRGGEFGNKDFGSTQEELSQAATLIFRRLEPLAKKGFWETGKPNVWAYLASAAYGLILNKGGLFE